MLVLIVKVRSKPPSSPESLKVKVKFRRVVFFHVFLHHNINAYFFGLDDQVGNPSRTFTLLVSLVPVPCTLVAPLNCMLHILQEVNASDVMYDCGVRSTLSARNTSGPNSNLSHSTSLFALLCLPEALS
jgi:hypothetical protein